MKTIHRRTETTIKTEHFVVIKHLSGWRAVYARCDKVVELLTPDEAAVIARDSHPTIYRAIEAEEIHCFETPKILICRDSLLARFDNSRSLPEDARPSTCRW
jgi:hypothetical protein